MVDGAKGREVDALLSLEPGNLVVRNKADGTVLRTVPVQIDYRGELRVGAAAPVAERRRRRAGARESRFGVLWLVETLAHAANGGRVSDRASRRQECHRRASIHRNTNRREGSPQLKKMWGLPCVGRSILLVSRAAAGLSRRAKRRFCPFDERLKRFKGPPRRRRH